ncbi:MAG: GlsB/YeaQ/YmgE family stress response membrane protein [Thermoguttaceae bacterium]
MDLSPAAQLWVNIVFVWIGFGVVVGLTSQFFLPAGEPRGLLGTLVVGILGSFAGPFAVLQLLRPEHFNPIGPVGFFASVIAAVPIVLCYRLIAAMIPSNRPNGHQQNVQNTATKNALGNQIPSNWQR